MDLFNQWSDHYDQTVFGHDAEYREVFENYDGILEAVAERSNGTVIEFGVGTGNLTEKLLRHCTKVYGVEPSEGMRAQFMKRGLEVTLLEGDFIQFPLIPAKVDAIVSTYAFHHLTDEEKEQAISLYGKLLGETGQIIFADTIFLNEQAREQTETYVKELGHARLLKDLRTEYYTTINVLEPIFIQHGFTVTFEKLNRYVWLIHAKKTSV